MAKNNTIATKLQDLLVTQNFDPTMLAATGQPANDPDDAKIFSFDYQSTSGKNYGTMVIVLGDENDLQIMYGDNLGRAMEDPEDRNEFFEFQHHLRDFAHRNRWTASPTDISKLRHVQSGIAAIKEGLFEGYYGTRQISYQGEPTQARLMIRHNRKLGETDARFRHVESLFIETTDNERFKLPFVNLNGGRAMLEHVRQGGRPYDIRGNHISEMVTELKVLNRFRRAAHSRVSESITQEIVEQADHYYGALRSNLKHLASSRGYQKYFESWHPAQHQPHESLVENIKSLFVEQRIDDRIEAALPLLARIQQGSEMKEIEIFENWIDRMGEGTWSVPKTDEQMQQLKMLASQPLPAGPDGTNATEQLHDLVGDDQLYDIIGNLASNDPDANIWDSEELWTRMKELGIDRGVLAPGSVGVQGAEQPQQPTPGSNAPQQTQPVAESGCNATMEGEYCPEHGLAECGSMYEGYSVVPDIDREKYQERSGLEGPFRTKSGKVVYYDKREGKYYDPNTDMYIEYDDWQAMNEGSKETPEKELERLGLRQNAQKNAPLRDQAATQARMRELKKQIVDKKQGMAEDSTDPMDHRGAVTDSFYEDLDRLKKLALNK